MPRVSMRSVSVAHWQNSWQPSDAWQLERSAGVAGYRHAFHDEALRDLERDEVPMRVRSRLQGARNGTLPWSATLTPAEC